MSREQKRAETRWGGGRWRTTAPPPRIEQALVGERLELWITASPAGIGFELSIQDVAEESVDISEHDSIKAARKHAYNMVGEVKWETVSDSR